MDIKTLIKESAAKVEARLNELLPGDDVAPVTLHKAMRYSIFAGGKRIRPLLCLEAAKACGGSEEATYPALVGMENARAEARALTAAARADLDVFSARRAENLLAISDYLLKRDY